MPFPAKEESFFEAAFSPHLIKRSLITAIFVGSVLNLINQWQALVGEAPLVWWTFLLTYLVPYCVSTFSGALSRLNFIQSQKEHEQSKDIERS